MVTPADTLRFWYFLGIMFIYIRWESPGNIRSISLSLFEGGKLRGNWPQGLPNFKFLSISRVYNFFPTLNRALKFSKSKELQKLCTNYSKNGSPKIKKNPKIETLDQSREPNTLKSHQLTYINLKIW